jgi:hypothetical protein
MIACQVHFEEGNLEVVKEPEPVHAWSPSGR